MDDDGNQEEHHLMRLGDAIKAELAATGRNQQWLAEALPIDDGQLSRILNGRSPKLALETVHRIEQLLGVRAGHLLRAAGYVEPLEAEVTVAEALAADPFLDEITRGSLLRLYEMSRGSGTSINIGSDSTAAAPRKRARTR